MKDANISHGTLEEITDKLGLYVKSIFDDSVTKRCEFRVGLSGGSAMDIFSKALLKKEVAASMDWSRWQVFWVDERWVPLTSEDSNYNKTKFLFLDYVNIPEDQIHFYNTSLTPHNAALAYENEIRTIFGTSLDEIPRFDLIVLGIGEDGHIASLFPGHPILEEKEHLVSYLVDAPKSPPVRMSFSLPLINNARHIAIVAVGPEKRTILEELLKNDLDSNLPASMVSLNDSEIEWFLDYDAY